MVMFELATPFCAPYWQPVFRLVPPDALEQEIPSGLQTTPPTPQAMVPVPVAAIAAITAESAAACATCLR